MGTLSSATRPSGLGPYRLLIALASHIVPSRERDEWRREWEAEVAARWHQLGGWGRPSPGARVELLRRCLGAFVDAGGFHTREHEPAVRDLRWALGALVRDPSFTVVAVGALAVALAMAGTAFGVVHAAVLTPLPFPESSHLV